MSNENHLTTTYFSSHFIQCVVVVVLFAIGIGLAILFYYPNCCCNWFNFGARNQYEEIQELEGGVNTHYVEDTILINEDKDKDEDGKHHVKPYPIGDAPDVLAQEIDYVVRHMEGFYVIGFYCSMVSLENQLNIPVKMRKKSIRNFLRSRPEFKMRSNLSAFKLTRLTPHRIEGEQVSGKFQCVNVTCKYKWRSLCTFADHYQKCKKCGARVYPFEQAMLTTDEIYECQKKVINVNYIDPSDVVQATK